MRITPIYHFDADEAALFLPPLSPGAVAVAHLYDSTTTEEKETEEARAESLRTVFGHNGGRDVSEAQLREAVTFAHKVMNQCDNALEIIGRGVVGNSELLEMCDNRATALLTMYGAFPNSSLEQEARDSLEALRAASKAAFEAGTRILHVCSTEV
jgi:hypothetical protein